MTDDPATAMTDGESQAEEDPMAQLAVALREILKDLPPRQQYRRVGWEWWYELQGVDPEPEEEPETDWSDRWSTRDWFDRCVEEMFAKKRQEKIEAGEAELR